MPTMRRAILIAVVLFCSEAAAEVLIPMKGYVTGNELFARCDGFTMTRKELSPGERSRFDYCNAYVAGVSDSLNMVAAESAQAGMKIYDYCQPLRCPQAKLRLLSSNTFATILNCDILVPHPWRQKH